MPACGLVRRQSARGAASPPVQASPSNVTPELVSPCPPHLHRRIDHERLAYPVRKARASSGDFHWLEIDMQEASR